MNDHLTDGTFKNASGGNINLGEGIIINGETLKYWVSYNPGTISYPRNKGVTDFPLYAGVAFNPIAIEVKDNALDFKIDLLSIPMDDITVTFKAGIFEGYNNGITYVLNEDLTFYSVATKDGGPARVTFVQEKNWQPIRNAFRSINDWGEKTASQGAKFHQYLMWTEIPFDREVIKQACPADNYRYMYSNLLMNDKPIAYYNAWARGNSKDFTDLTTPTQNPDYEVGHPLGDGKINTTYDLAIRVEIVRDQPVYAFVFSVPNQLVEDLSLGTLTFSLREGASFLTKDAAGNFMVGRIDTPAFNNMVLAAKEELEDYVDFNDYTEDEQAQIVDIISNAQTDMQNAVSQSQINIIVKDAKLLIDDVMSPEEKLIKEHIQAVVALVDAIPAEITYTPECSNAVNAAKEAFAGLTDAEIAKFPADKLTALYNASNTLAALDLANYKSLSKVEVSSVNTSLYRDLEKSAVSDLKAQTYNAIDAATSKADIQAVVDSFFASIKEIPTDAQLTKQELDAAKVNAKTQLDAVDLSVYRPGERAIVEEVITNGKVAIDQCENTIELNTLVEKIMNVVNNIQTSDQIEMARRQNVQRTTVITSISVGSVLLALGVGLSIFLIRRRKFSK